MRWTAGSTIAGEVIEPLDREAVARAARALVAAGAQSIGVCFLFSFTNPAHEREAAAIIRDVAPGIFVSLSSEVNPEWREYERTASTVANAYIGPPVSRYLEQLQAISLQPLSGLPHADDEIGRWSAAAPACLRARPSRR